jgi:hypothetical protein
MRQSHAGAVDLHIPQLESAPPVDGSRWILAGHSRVVPCQDLHCALTTADVRRMASIAWLERATAVLTILELRCTPQRWAGLL